MLCILQWRCKVRLCNTGMPTHVGLRPGRGCAGRAPHLEERRAAQGRQNGVLLQGGAAGHTRGRRGVALHCPAACASSLLGGAFWDAAHVACLCDAAWRSCAWSEQPREGCRGATCQCLYTCAQEFAGAHGFSMEDLGWLFATRSSASSAERETAMGAWTAIAKRLPHRRVKAVWAAGTRMLHEGNFRVSLSLCMTCWRKVSAGRSLAVEVWPGRPQAYLGSSSSWQMAHSGTLVEERACAAACHSRSCRPIGLNLSLGIKQYAWVACRGAGLRRRRRGCWRWQRRSPGAGRRLARL